MKRLSLCKFLSIAAVCAYLMACAACGRSSSDPEAYSETISAEDFMAAEALAPVEPQTPQRTLPSPEDSAEEKTPVADPAVSDSPGRHAADTLAGEDLQHVRVRAAGNLGNLAKMFNDSNHFQLLHAQRLGITPISDLRSYYHNVRPLVKIESNENILVDNLTHSYPYLIPEASALLNDIGRNFRDSLKSKGGKDYRIIVTSMLRTPATVKKLRRVNRNATELSTHQYATTFDISYARFDPVSGVDDTNHADLKMVLAEVIRDLHREGRCMVKYEIKSPCFHITVVR